MNERIPTPYTHMTKSHTQKNLNNWCIESVMSPDSASDAGTLRLPLLCFLDQCARRFINFIGYSQRISFGFTDVPYCFSLLIFTHNYFLSVTLNLICSSISSFFKWKLRLLVCSISSLLIQALSPHKFPQELLLPAASHKFWYVVFSFSFCEKCCLVPLLVDSFTHGLFRKRVLFFSFKIFGGFAEIFLLLKDSISS